MGQRSFAFAQDDSAGAQDDNLLSEILHSVQEDSRRSFAFAQDDSAGAQDDSAGAQDDNQSWQRSKSG